MSTNRNDYISGKDGEERRVTVNGNLAMIVEILIDLARAHKHQACADTGLATQETQAGQEQCLSLLRCEMQ